MVYQSDNAKNEAKVSRNKMKIKTTWDILEWFENKIYDIKEPKEYNNDKYKKWVSVDSLLEVINKMEQGYKDIGEHNAYVSRICFDLRNKVKELEEK